MLMGFPASWQLPKGSRAVQRCIGNAVPPPLAAAIVRARAHSQRPKKRVTFIVPSDARSVRCHSSERKQTPVPGAAS